MRKCRRSTLRYRAKVSTFHASLPCANGDAQLYVIVRGYRFPTLLYRVQIWTHHFSLPCVSIHSLPCANILYHTSLILYHTSLPCANMDAPLFVTVREYSFSTVCKRLRPTFVTVREYRLPTLLYRVQMSTPHFSLPCASTNSPHHSTLCKCRRSTFRYHA